MCKPEHKLLVGRALQHSRIPGWCTAQGGRRVRAVSGRGPRTRHSSDGGVRRAWDGLRPRPSIHHADGRLLRVRVVGEALRAPDGRITHIEGAFHDITEQEAERAARAAVEERLESTLDSLSDGLLIFDSEWRYSYLNPKALEILGLDLDSVLGTVFWDIAPEPVRSTFGAAMRSAADDGRTIITRQYHPIIDRWLEVDGLPDGVGSGCLYPRCERG